MNKRTATPLQDPLVSLVVPIFNEEPYLDELMRRLYELPFRTELILVDDGSTDGSLEICERHEAEHDNVIVIAQEQNQGKGAAVRAGIARSTGDLLAIQDADLEYDPANLPKLIEPIVRGDADVVYGSRFSGGEPQRVHLFWHSIGNRFLTFLTGMLFNTTLSDMETGYKAFRGELIRSIPLRSNDFRIEPEITAKICKRDLRIYELPIAYYGRSFDEGKKITWRDGITALGALIVFRISD
ncbi:MAG: glycosyltransferase family 2 protein [Solirubrobacterales bacterium]